MATEKRLIDANALLRNQVWICGGFVGDPYCDGYMEALDKVETVIREFPTVDAVEVVRCADCKYWCEDTLSCTMGNHYDDNWYAEDFCSYGKKKNGGSGNGI